jgi:Mrp family chromosome partitioning ATPase
MATAADGVLIVSRAGETRRGAVAEVLGVLRRLRANVIGVVLNQMSQNTAQDGYAAYGYHRYNYSEYQKSARS